MNTNPSAKRILCYGDSNTWGFIPLSGKRYPADVRWPGVLQDLLGNDYEVIEEGLNSRTTNINDPKNFGRNAKTYLIPCLKAQNPLDLVILFLGTNDMKARFNRSLPDIETGIRELITEIRERRNYSYDKIPHIILLSPPVLEDSIEYVKKKFAGAKVKSLKLPSIFEKVALDVKCDYINIQAFLKPSLKDGCHLEPEDHRLLGKVIAEKIREYYI